MYADGFRATEYRYESTLLINTSTIGLFYLQCEESKDGVSAYISEKLTVYGMFQMISLKWKKCLIWTKKINTLVQEMYKL